MVLVLGSGIYAKALPSNAHEYDSRSSREVKVQEIITPTASEKGEHGDVHLGEMLQLWTVIPFLGILLSIALFPLFAPHFWHNHFPKISAFWGLIFAIPFLLNYGTDAIHEILHTYLLEYLPFIILLWSLFTIAGGILIKGTLRGTPAVNLLIILIGTAMASWVGTTGAAMITIRPLLRANAHRRHKVHLVVMFIFLVANIGGSLTPLGDPPLFLGFLNGVSFFWTFNLFPEMALISILLLAILFAFDSYYYRKEGVLAIEDNEKVPIKIEGSANFLFLLGVVGGVLFSGSVRLGEFTLFGIHMQIQDVCRDGWLILMGLLSLRLTRKETRKGNEFSWFPIKEVAILFAGIFMTMIPVLVILRAGERGALAFIITAVKEPAHYFWITGALSSFLDNAPTYLTFFNSALGKLGLTQPEIREAFLGNSVPEQFPQFLIYLKAISVGAVFMGANTYIGNAPNFMVRSIAEEAGVPMPSFLGYLFKYTLTILLPLFVIVSFIFF